MNVNNFVKIRLSFEEERKPYLLDVSSLLYDFELLHDLSLLLFEKNYYDFKFSQYFWYRGGRPLKDEHRLRASKIIKESPLTVELLLSSVAVFSGAIWVIVQAIEKISNWKLNRIKLNLEIEKLEYENNIRFYNEQKAKADMEKKLRERECMEIFYSLIKRLESNSIKLIDIDLYIEKKD